MNCTCGGTFQSDGFCDTCGDPQVKPALTPPTPLPSAPAPSARQAASNAPAAVDGAPCQEAGCAGHYDGGYCDNCGSAPKPVAVAAPLASEAAPASAKLAPDSGRLASAAFQSRRSGSQGSRRTALGSRRVTTRSAMGAGLVNVAPIPVEDPSAAVMTTEKMNAEVDKSFAEAGGAAALPEHQRTCAKCGNQVGRSRDGGTTPGRIKGACTQCGTQFDFTPKGRDNFMPALKTGELVGGQYEVVGPIAHGGMGWITLAKDKNLSNRWVVLKSVLNSGDASLTQAIETERRFLATLEHPNIVKVYNFVQHKGAHYIVMEYVGGRSLKQLLKQRLKDNGGTANPLPVGEAIAYMLAVLPAFSYLHKLGLVYCDFKPDNLMHRADQITLIDVGGVRKLDDEDSDIFGTNGFQAPEIEAGTLPSVSSDLFTIGRTLAQLIMDFKGNTSTYKYTLPPPAEQPLLAANDSLYRFLLKATAQNPDDRFQSADEMAEQLTGVLREIVARQEGTPKPAASSFFRSDQLAQKVQAGATIAANWRFLPLLQLDRSDAAAGYLEGAGNNLPGDEIARLIDDIKNNVVPNSAEVELRLAYDYTCVGQFDAAEAQLKQVEQQDSWDWRVSWYRGLSALAQSNCADAKSHFNLVVADLPGELAPKLALALACELDHDLVNAAALYDVVGDVDRGFVSSAFGLARVFSAQADRQAAVEALKRVPQSSSVYTLAQQAAVRILIGGNAGVNPSPSQIEQASQLLEKLTLDAKEQAAIAVEVFDAALSVITAGGGLQQTAVAVLKQPFEEAAVRRGLETSYRELARLTDNPDERIALVDKANSVRPRTRK